MVLLRDALVARHVVAGKPVLKVLVAPRAHHFNLLLGP